MLGNVFLRSHLTVFNRTASTKSFGRVGFIQNKWIDKTEQVQTSVIIQTNTLLIVSVVVGVTVLLIIIVIIWR